MGGFAAAPVAGLRPALPFCGGIPPHPLCGGAPPPGPPGELFLWRKSSQKAREGRLASLPNPSTRGQPRDPARGYPPKSPQKTRRTPSCFLHRGRCPLMTSIFSACGSKNLLSPLEGKAADGIRPAAFQKREPARHSSWRSTRRQYSSDMELHPHTRMATEPRSPGWELAGIMEWEAWWGIPVRHVVFHHLPGTLGKTKKATSRS